MATNHRPFLYAGAAVVGFLAFAEYKKGKGSSGSVGPTYPALNPIPVTISMANLFASAQAGTVHPSTADVAPTGASTGGRIPPVGTLLYDAPRGLPTRN